MHKPVFLALFAVTILLAACGDPDANVPAIAMQGNEFTFQPATVTLKQGQRVRITLQNTGQQTHDINSEIPATNVVERSAGAHTHTTPPADVHVMVDKGRTATLIFTPTQAGTFDFWCSLPGHREAGMEGRFTVE
jgi:uncharacterized cupredoxin-like copper-binding protein